MATAAIRTTTPKVPSNFGEKIFYQIGRRPHETDRFNDARQKSQLLTFPFAF